MAVISNADTIDGEDQLVTVKVTLIVTWGLRA